MMAGNRRAATFELERDKWGLSFSGTLNKRTLDRMFLTAPVPIGLLQGDFAVNVFTQTTVSIGGAWNTGG